ncbi:hypothetical protein ACFL7E_03585 [Thermodesulfobacteriota bacterium]
MDSQITMGDLKKIEAGIREKYIKVVKSPEGQFKYSTGKKGLEALYYDKTMIDKRPDAVVSSYCGVGNPFSLVKINTGEEVLDIGCGAGVDTILASILKSSEKNLVVIFYFYSHLIHRLEKNAFLTIRPVPVI